MKSNSPLADIAAVLRERERFLVLSHIRPDGDALGSTLAIALCLRQLGKEVVAWNEDGVLEKFRSLPGSALLTKPPAEPADFDAVIAVDCAARDRLGRGCLNAVRDGGLWINLDHHVSNERYGDLVHVDSSAPATGQIVYELIRGEDLPFTYEMADNIFVAISTDTGSFQYPNTTARTFEIGAALVQAGVNVGQLSQRLYESYPRRRIELLRALLNVLKFTSHDRVASFALDLPTVAAVGAQPEDNEGLIDYIRAIQGVVVAAFFEDLPDGKVRVSLRSKDPRIDVCKVCAQFGGGGHTLASGARVTGTLAEVERNVLAAIAHEFPS